MSKCISNRGEYSEHTFTHNPECDYCGELPASRFESMRAALEAIQEQHTPQLVEDFFNAIDGSSANRWKRVCASCDFDDYPCPTRKLADEALGGVRNVAKCKPCHGGGKLYGAFGDSWDCIPCRGTGQRRTGPYRLADGTWSDGVERTSMIKLHKFHIANPSRPIVIQTWDQRQDGGYDWVAIESKYAEPEYFRTHAEAIAYADRMARTNQGENQ